MAHRYIKAINSAPNTGTNRAEWVPNTAYAVGDRVVCRRAYGTLLRRIYVYECTVGGTSHATTEPTWPTSSTVTDGTVTWTTRNPTTWANASIYIDYLMAVNGTAAFAAGDYFWVDSTSVQALTGNLEFGDLNWNPGSYDTPTFVISTSDLVNEPPTSRAVGATFRATGYIVPRASSLHFYGCTLEPGYGASSGTPHMYLSAYNTSVGIGTVWERCAIKLAYAVTGCYVYTGNPSPSVYAGATSLFLNSTIELTHAGQVISIGPNFRWYGGSLLGTAPTTCFGSTASKVGGRSEITGVDLSLVSGNLIDITNFDAGESLLVSRCKLNAGVTLYTGTAATYMGTSIVVECCDNGTGSYKFRTKQRGGTISEETTYVRTGGASDGVTPLSWKLIAEAANSQHALETPWMATWVDSVGQERTFTVEILHDSANALTDVDVWMEGFFLTNSGWPQAEHKSDRGTFVMSGTAQAASTATWYTTGMTNPNKQKLTITASPQMKGLATTRVRFAKPTYTLYIDPKITVT